MASRRMLAGFALGAPRHGIAESGLPIVGRPPRWPFAWPDYLGCMITANNRSRFDWISCTPGFSAYLGSPSGKLMLS